MTPLLILDDDGFETYAEDIVLTPTPRPVVDWGMIPMEVVEMILKFAEYNDVEWRVNQFKTHVGPLGLRRYPRIRPVFDRRPIYHRMSDCHGVWKELSAMFKVSQKRGKPFRPSMVKYKYMKNDEDVKSAVRRMDSRKIGKHLYPENQKSRELSHKIRKKLEE